MLISKIGLKATLESSERKMYNYSNQNKEWNITKFAFSFLYQSQYLLINTTTLFNYYFIYQPGKSMLSWVILKPYHLQYQVKMKTKKYKVA